MTMWIIAARLSIQYSLVVRQSIIVLLSHMFLSQHATTADTQSTTCTCNATFFHPETNNKNKYKKHDASSGRFVKQDQWERWRAKL